MVRGLAEVDSGRAGVQNPSGLARGHEVAECSRLHMFESSAGNPDGSPADASPLVVSRLRVSPNVYAAIEIEPP